MVHMRAAFISTTALVALIQFSPAPFAAAIPAAISVGMAGARAMVGVARAVKGGVKVAKNVDKMSGEQDTSEDEQNQKRAIPDMHVIRTFNRVDHIAARQDPNQRAWELCHEQLGSATVEFSAPGDGEVLAKGLPPACMTLSGVLTGEYNEGNPVPQGTDSILFTGLSESSIQEIQDALDQKQGKK
ncbi:hypothetical protein Daus18300_000158 [Diaporthe australafricana]|uniref:Uncharacterized protein n=1 Tax=Diaporthe australafricana TaxID=127596 RepID=A0ABR3Y6Z4_9PEZI